MASENSIYYLLALAVLAVLVIMNGNSSRRAAANGSSPASSSSSSSPVLQTNGASRNASDKNTPLGGKREVTCEECLKPKDKCDDCIKQPGLACLKHHFGVGNNVRAASWTDLFHRMNDLSEKIQTIVELGTSSLGEKSCVDTGCSTVLFSQWVKNRNDLFASKKQVVPATLYSVDASKDKISKATETYSKYPEVFKGIQFSHHEKLVDFINNFNRPIDILYMDGNDAENTKEVQREHLAEIRAALPRLTKHGMVVIDNVGKGHGNLVIQELATKGFKILSDDFQAILTRPAIADSVKNEISRRSEWMAESKKN